MTTTPESAIGFPLEILEDKNRMLDILSAGTNDTSKQMLIEKLNILTRTYYHPADESHATGGVRRTEGHSLSHNFELTIHDFSNEFVAGFISCYDLINNSKELTYMELDRKLGEMVDNIFDKIDSLKTNDYRLGGEKDSKKEFLDLLRYTHKHFQGRIAPRPMGPRKY